MHRRSKTIIQAALCAVISGATIVCAHAGSPDPVPFEFALRAAPASSFTRETAERLRRHRAELGEVWTADAQADYDEYRRHYQFALDHHTVAAGSVMSNAGESIFVQILRKSAVQRPDSRIVLFVHGYLDHTATNRYAIEALLDSGATVITLDLPGHGLSTGRRAYIDDFARYGQVVELVLVAVEETGLLGSQRLSGLTGIGHSTGASALLEHAERYDPRFSRLVFAAPLIRVFAFPVLRAGADIVGQFVTQLPDRISGSTTNRTYIEFAEEYDHLRISHTDLRWFQSYLEWEESLSDMSERTVPLLLVLASDDTVVDSDYNEEFLQNLFTDIRVLTIPDVRHGVFTEQFTIESMVMNEIVRFALD